MKLSSKLFALISLLVLTYVVALVFLTLQYSRTVDTLFEAEQLKQKKAFASIVNLNSVAIAGFDKDYSRWDDMVDWIRTGDTEAASSNLDAALPSYKANVLWLYGPSGELVYTHSLLGSSTELVAAPHYQDAIESIRTGKYLHYYATTTLGILEVHGSSVVPTADVDRATAPRGYFFVGKLIDQGYLNILTGLTEDAVSLDSQDIEVPPNNPFSVNQDFIVRTTFVLRDSSGSTLAYIHVEKKSELIQEIVTSSRKIFITSALSVAAGIVILFVALYVLIIKPLRKISSSLWSDNEEPIRYLRTRKDEFGGIANALALFFQQNNDLKSSNEKIQALLENMGDGMIAIDTNWNIVEWNKAAANISGWSRAEVLGKPFREYVHFIRERDRSENLIFIEEAMLYGKVKTMENHTVLVRKDKTEVPVGDSVSPIFDQRQKVVGVIIVFRDMTDEIKSQSLKTDFKYASHQMRTPVTKVLWSLEAAIDATDEKERKELMTSAFDSAQSISKMNDQLLAVSEIDQNTILVHKEPIDITAIINKTIEDCMPVAVKSGIKISFPHQIPSATIEADPTLCRRIMLELVDNAIKFNKPNGEVTISLGEQEPSVVVEIKDTGIGILEEQQPLIFTKFFRGANFDTSKIAGAGVGLFISRSYANLLKGKLWFTSEVNVTTSFFVSFPRSTRILQIPAQS